MEKLAEMRVLSELEALAKPAELHVLGEYNALNKMTALQGFHRVAILGDL